MTISRMQEPRQLYGLGSLVKKITRPIKKIVKSPIGKAALTGAAIYFGGGGGNPFTAAGRSKFGSNVFGSFLKDSILGKQIASGERGITREGGLLGLLKSGFSGAASGFGNLSTGQKAFLLGGAGLSLLPFLTGGDEEEETVVEEGFDVTPGTITNIVAQARGRDPSLRFLPQTQFAQPGFFRAAEGGTPREMFAGGASKNRVAQLLQLLEGTKDPMDRRMIQEEIDMLLGKFAKGGIARLNLGMGGSITKAMEMGLSKDQALSSYKSFLKLKDAGFQMSFFDFLSGEMFATGGRVGLREGTGGIAELPQVRMLEGGVPEIDYRQSGGFVPMGKKEKADDVPAMLSKNEFVMTADAVRGMGDGNVEKGAQRMYDQMRQLENRVV